MQVSSDGELVYGFAPDFRSRLRSRSLLIAATPLLRRAAGVLSYLTRVVFGTALIASVVLVWLAITVLLSSRGDDRDDRRRGHGGVGLFINPVDLFWYWDPYYYRYGNRTGVLRGVRGGERVGACAAGMGWCVELVMYVRGPPVDTWSWWSWPVGGLPTR